MVLSTRISLQWLPEQPEELSHTMVFTSPKDHFVDVRILKSRYPYLQDGKVPEPFEDVFQWVITGVEESIEGTNKISFNHEINLVEVMESAHTGKPIEECRGAPDIGAFWDIEGSEDRKETGVMMHPDTHKVTEYVEIWRSLDPLKHTPDTEVRESESEVKSVVLEPVLSLFLGKIVRLGNWVLGILYEKSEKTYPLSVFRSYFNEEKNAWIPLIVYGLHSFPESFEWQRGETTTAGPIEWKCIE